MSRTDAIDDVLNHARAWRAAAAAMAIAALPRLAYLRDGHRSRGLDVHHQARSVTPGTYWLARFAFVPVAEPPKI